MTNLITLKFSKWGMIFLLTGMILYFFTLLNLKTTTIVLTLPLSHSSYPFSLSFSWDWISLSFLGTISFIAGSVLIFSYDYSMEEPRNSQFLPLLLLFILSSFSLVSSSNFMALIIGWDSLGVSSFLLVIYFQNKSSLQAGLLTISSNRIGDIALILILAWSLQMLTTEYTSYFFISKKFLFSMILFAALTKSAQFPFSAWLPAAMAAPTPVSSLVHSSTLVTAGVYLLIRLNFLTMYPLFKSCLLFSSFITSMVAGWAALFEWDLKKVIASSTLSQLAFMMFSLSNNLWELTFFHSTTHAFFKALMFLCGGYILHSHFGTQDIRFSMDKKIPLIPSMGLMVSILCLVGSPFFAGFYSKDLILEAYFILPSTLFSKIILTSILLLSVLYSLRSFSLLATMNVKFTPSKISSPHSSMELGILILTLMSVSSGALLQWKLNLAPLYIPLPLFSKTLGLMIFILGLMIYISYNLQSFLNPPLIFFYPSQSFLFLPPYSYNLLYLWLKSPSSIKSLESYWLENTSSMLLNIILKFFSFTFFNFFTLTISIILTILLWSMY